MLLTEQKSQVTSGNLEVNGFNQGSLVSENCIYHYTDLLTLGYDCGVNDIFKSHINDVNKTDRNANFCPFFLKERHSDAISHCFLVISHHLKCFGQNRWRSSQR